jgi:hypothetical protein
MSETLSGDPFHEGGSQPMASLKGGQEAPHTQQPLMSSNSGDTDGNTVTPGIAGWDSTSLAPSAGKNGSNDKNKAH